MEQAPIAAGPLGAKVREHIGYCPVCETNRPSLPEPAEGTCAYCYNHLMKPCADCANYVHRTDVDPVCIGSPEGRRMSAWYARQEEDLCGAAGAWAVFPNAKVTGAAPEKGLSE